MYNDRKNYYHHFRGLTQSKTKKNQYPQRGKAERT